ncbi:MAG: DUF533 domain-containing protein [Pseudomonadota bacterium]
MPLDKILQSGSKNAALTGALSGVAGGALVSAFTNKKSAKKLLKTGGLVALGGVAWHALQKYREGQAADPAQAGPVPDKTLHATTNASQAYPQVPATEAALLATDLRQADFDAVVEDNSAGTLLIIEAMVAAGYADGHLTDLEQRRIWQQAIDQELDGDALAQLKNLLENPRSMQEVVAQADDMETRIEVYTASVLAIDEYCEAGRRYLQDLAEALQLPSPLVAVLNGESAAR